MDYMSGIAARTGLLSINNDVAGWAALTSLLACQFEHFQQRLALDNHIEIREPDLTAYASTSRSIAANSALTRMLSPRTLREASRRRLARRPARVSRFLSSSARRTYSARVSRTASAQRPDASRGASGTFNEMAAAARVPFISSAPLSS